MGDNEPDMISTIPRPAFFINALKAMFGADAAERASLGRVKAAIQTEQETGEHLICLAQGAAIVVWAILYSAARKTAPLDAAFQPVPWTLGAYMLFTAFRCFLAFKRRLTPWMLTISIVVDVAVLMILIWAFHLQYHQEPSFYLKAPTLLYVFIFIALRTLRYEPIWVVVTGLASALGWAVLLVYAIIDQWRSMPLTHDYVVYMTSSSILIGAEVDKIVSILMVTGILAIGLHRGRRLLARAVSDRLVASDLGKFVGEGVVDKVAGAEVPLVPGTAETREVAVLFVDLRGFTTLTEEMEPPQLMSLLADYRTLVAAAVHRNAGSIDKFIGDGIMASFGAVQLCATCAADALLAATDISRELAQWRKGRQDIGLVAPDFGVGISSGKALLGVFGSSDRYEYTVMGDPVNMAAKLEKATKAVGAHALTTRETFLAGIRQGLPADPKRDMLLGRRIQGVDHYIDLVKLD